MKKIIILIAAVVALAGLLTGITIFANNPKAVALNSIEDFLGEIGKREELEPLVNMARGGSLSFMVADAENEDNYVSSEIFFDMDDAQKFAVMFNDFTVSSADASIKADLYLGYDYMYITEEDVLNGTYGLVRGKMADSYEESIFAHDSDSKYEFDSDIHEIVLKVLETYDNADDQNTVKDGEKIAKRYVRELKKLLGKYSEFEKENEDVKLGGERFGARVITVTITPETLENVLNDLLDYVKNDKGLRKYFISSVENFGISDDAEYLWDNFIEEFEEVVDEFDPDEADGKLKIKVFTPKTSSELLGMSVTVYEGKDKEELFFADFGKKGFCKTDRITLVFAEETIVEYKVSESNSKEYKSSLSVDDEKVMSFKWDKKAGKYTLKLYEDDEEIVVSGKLTRKSGKLSVSVNEINSEETPVEVTFTINEKAKMPKKIAKSDVKLITGLTEEDIDAIAENLRKLVDRSIAEPEEIVPDYYW